MTFEIALCYLSFDSRVRVENLTINASQNYLVVVVVAVVVVVDVIAAVVNL